MKIEKQLPHQVHRYIEAHHLLDSAAPLVVGVSGGPDSVCLLHALASLRKKLGIGLHVAHLNHQLRGPESDADAEYVYGLARDLDLPATIDARDVRQYRADHGTTLEEAAREVRYAFFAEVAESTGAGAAAVAHTADDQIETILMHLIRGTGLTGLRGMQPRVRRELPGGRLLLVIRPLLETKRQETEAYCAAHELAPRHDSSNDSADHLRNRIRGEVMPLLSDYNPNIVDTLSRTARIISDDVAYLDGEARKLSASMIEPLPQGICLNNRAVTALPPALARHLVRDALGHALGGSPRDVEMSHVQSILEAMEHPAGKEIHLPQGLIFYGDYERSVISAGANPLALLPEIEGECRLKVPGQATFCGWRMSAGIIEGKPGTLGEDDLTAHLDFGLSGEDLTIRGRRDGDRFHPLGMSQPKRLQDFMVDSKIPRAWRDRVPLVCAGDRIVWVAGWRIDHATRVTDSTERTLRLKFELE